MKVFVCGGTGFVGSHLVDELLRCGHQVRLLVHHRAIDRDGVEHVEGDGTSPESFEAALSGCDAVANLVGIIREFPARQITFARLHVAVTANMLAAAARHGIKRYLHMSALGTRDNAVSNYHRTKFMAEELVRRSKLDWTIFRPSLIYGPGDAFITMLADQLRAFPVIPVIGDGCYRLQPIHAADVAAGFVKSLAIPQTIGRIYELCGSQRMSYVELLDAVAEALGRSRPLKLHLPLMLMKPLVHALQGFAAFPVTSDQLQMLLEENICSGQSADIFGLQSRDLLTEISAYL